jgi:cytochrome c553
MRPIRTLAAVLAGAVFLSHTAAAQTDEHPPDTMSARVLACTGCHGVEGRGTDNDYFPRLAGKPSGYLYNQLVAFREARRRYPPMNYLLEFQSDGYLRLIADYFAEQNPPFRLPATPIVSPDLLAPGRSLTVDGDAGRAIPACTSCHNAQLTGMQPAVPGLLGLPSDYISAQLGAWRYGTRTAAEPDCMQIVAGHLTETDVTALSAWLSSLPVPVNATQVPQGSLAMPLPCGSQPN